MPTRPANRIEQIENLMEQELINATQARELLADYGITDRTIAVPPDNSGIIHYRGEPPSIAGTANTFARADHQHNTLLDDESVQVVSIGDTAYYSTGSIKHGEEYLNELINKLIDRITTLEEDNKRLKLFYEDILDKELERGANESSVNNG